MRYQTTIAISKFGSFIFEGFLYVPPTRFEPMLFRTSCLQAATLQVLATIPGIYPIHPGRERTLYSSN